MWFSQKKKKKKTGRKSLRECHDPKFLSKTLPTVSIDQVLQIKSQITPFKLNDT